MEATIISLHIRLTFVFRYIDTNPLNTDSTNKYHGTTAEFKAMWTAVAKAVDRSKVKMFWSPVGPFKAGDTIATLNNDWYPGDDVVDLVGLDAVRRPSKPPLAPFLALHAPSRLLKTRLFLTRFRVPHSMVKYITASNPHSTTLSVPSAISTKTNLCTLARPAGCKAGRQIRRSIGWSRSVRQRRWPDAPIILDFLGLSI